MIRPMFIVPRFLDDSLALLHRGPTQLLRFGSHHEPGAGCPGGRHSECLTAKKFGSAGDAGTSAVSSCSVAGFTGGRGVCRTLAPIRAALIRCEAAACIASQSR